MRGSAEKKLVRLYVVQSSFPVSSHHYDKSLQPDRYEILVANFEVDQAATVSKLSQSRDDWI